jgi:hypothetical protein
MDFDKLSPARFHEIFRPCVVYPEESDTRHFDYFISQNVMALPQGFFIQFTDAELQAVISAGLEGHKNADGSCESLFGHFQGKTAIESFPNTPAFRKKMAESPEGTKFIAALDALLGACGSFGVITLRVTPTACNIGSSLSTTTSTEGKGAGTNGFHQDIVKYGGSPHELAVHRTISTAGGHKFATFASLQCAARATVSVPPGGAYRSSAAARGQDGNCLLSSSTYHQGTPCDDLIIDLLIDVLDKHIPSCDAHFAALQQPAPVAGTPGWKSSLNDSLSTQKARLDAYPN